MREPSARPLRELLEGASVIAHAGDIDVPVRRVQHDSRKVGGGDLFCAIDGARARGLDFAADAVGRGAVAVLSERELPSVGATRVQVADARAAMALAASAAEGHPTSRIPTVGITGTNGKTTTTYLLEAAFRGAGLSMGVIGTINARLGAVEWPAALTTPEAPELHALAAEMVGLGAAGLVMEVSSHAIALGRTHGVRFRAVAFTNLTQDHLDFHGTMEEYGAAKLRLFTDELAFAESPIAVVNVDDPFGRTVAARAACPVISVSAEGRPEADVRVVRSRCTLEGLEAELRVSGESVDVRSMLVGRHNVANVALALGVVHALGRPSLAEAVEGIALLGGVPGRLERVADPRGSAVLVDYAHTPDALGRIVDEARSFARGRVIVVFGCGGDRDRSKRPLMGEAAARGDLVLVTSDNPRTEDPKAIIEMVLPGVRRSALPAIDPVDAGSASRGYVVEPDRRTAIRLAVASARPGDVVLVAGKGHEPYQILGERRIHFDDREEAEAAVRAAGAGGSESR